MTGLALYILIGDLVVCAAVVGIAIWLLGYRKDDKSLDDAARLPLEEPRAKDG